MDKIICIGFNNSKYLTPEAQAIALGTKVKEDGLRWRDDFYWYVDENKYEAKIYFVFREINSAAYYRLKWINEIYQ